ncbi:MAG: hypothetical protein P8Y53_07965 [Pseudolabrys sp.]
MLDTVSARDVPSDLESIARFPDWRRSVWWPIGIAEANDIAVAQVRHALGWAESLDDPLAHDAVLLALPQVLSYARTLVIETLALSRAAAAGIGLQSGAPELDYICSGEGQPYARSGSIMPIADVRFPLLRRMTRIKGWSGLPRLPSALLAPDAVAVSHNPLLLQAAAKETRALGFLHAESLLAQARSRAATPPSLADQVEAGAEMLMPETAIAEPFRQRLQTVLETLVANNLAQCMTDMAGMRTIRLPDEVWSGSGGLYAPRAVGIEALRRGGRVLRFDHGTPRGFVGTPEPTCLLELAVASSFLLTTKAAAEICREQNLSAAPPVRRFVEIDGLDGDPAFTGLPRQRSRGRPQRPRIVYAPTQLLGFRQLLPVQQPDVIYLDWQLRVAEVLRSLPVELVCQVHPEGYFRSRPHPMESVAPTLRGNFRAQLETARLKASASSKSFQVVQAPEVPEVKSGPNRVLFTIVVVLIVFLLSAAYSVLSERLSARRRTRRPARHRV